jgi:hypothetical protein
MGFYENIFVNGKSIAEVTQAILEHKMYGYTQQWNLLETLLINNPQLVVEKCIENEKDWFIVSALSADILGEVFEE